MQLASAIFICGEKVEVSHNTKVTNRSSKNVTEVKYLAFKHRNQNCIHEGIEGRFSG